MNYAILDIETTGIPGKDGNIEDLQIIEFGAIIEDTKNPLSYDKIPKYNRIIRHEHYQGGAFAIHLNARIFKILADRELYKQGEERDAYDKHHGIISISELALDFFQFLYPYFSKSVDDKFSEGLIDYGQAPFVVTPAGKNFDAFDRNFIKLIPMWDQYINLRHRTIDPTSLYIDWYSDETPPGLPKCLSRAGIDKKVSHCAVEDCWDTLQVIRPNYNEKRFWM